METEIPEDDEDELVFELGHDDDESRGGYIIQTASRPRLFGPWAEDQAFFARGLDNTNDKLLKAAELLREGWGVTHFNKSGVAGRWAVARLRMALELIQGERFKCGCGRDSRHKGACLYRRSISEKFQARTKNRKTRAQLAAEYRARNPELVLTRKRALYARKKQERLAAAQIDLMLTRVLARVKLSGRWRDVSLPDGRSRVLDAFANEEGRAIRRIDAWHRCAEPKPPWGVFLNIVKELHSDGLVQRIGSANNAPFVAVSRGMQ